jgi:hypothetical protein
MRLTRVALRRCPTATSSGAGDRPGAARRDGALPALSAAGERAVQFTVETRLMITRPGHLWHRSFAALHSPSLSASVKAWSERSNQVVGGKSCWAQTMVPMSTKRRTIGASVRSRLQAMESARVRVRGSWGAPTRSGLRCRLSRARRLLRRLPRSPWPELRCCRGTGRRSGVGSHVVQDRGRRFVRTVFLPVGRPTVDARFPPVELDQSQVYRRLSFWLSGRADW